MTSTDPELFPEDLPGDLIIDLPTEHGPVDPRSEFRRNIARPRTLLSFLLALVIFAIFIVRTDINFQETLKNIRAAEWHLVLLAALIHFATFFVRGYRWQLMLERVLRSEESELQPPPVRDLSGIILISWFVNGLVPAKLGDFYRAYLLREDSGIRYTTGLGSIVAERILDLIVLFALMASSALLAFHGSIPGEAETALAVGIALLGLGLVAFGVSWVMRHRIEDKLPDKYKGQFIRFYLAFIDSLRSPLLPVLLTVLIWSLDGVRVLLVSRSVGVDLGYSTSLFVALMSALLTTIPFTPAGLGVVEVATISVLKLVDVPPDLASSVAILDRMITYWLVLLVGFIVYLLRFRPRSPQSR